MSSRSKSGSPSRKEAVEALRKQQRAAERRKTLLFVGVAAVVGVGLIAAAAVPLALREDPAEVAFSSLGVPAASAECDPVSNDEATGSGDHVELGSVVDYSQTPPAFGSHWGQWDNTGRKFYTADDEPRVEEIVHNLEHGYTVLWYSPDVSDADRETLEKVAERAAAMDETTAGTVTGRFKAVEFPAEGYGEWPEGKPFVLAHWSGNDGAGKQFGHRQECGQLSGEVVEAFVEQFPATDAPEPGAG